MLGWYIGIVCIGIFLLVKSVCYSFRIFSVSDLIQNFTIFIGGGHGINAVTQFKCIVVIESGFVLLKF